MAAVEAHCKKFKNDEDLRQLEELTATGLVAQALASGDINSVRDGLRKRKLEVPVEKALRHMQLCMRNIRGSEGEKDSLMPRIADLVRLQFLILHPEPS